MPMRSRLVSYSPEPSRPTCFKLTWFSLFVVDGDTTKGKNGAVGRHLQSAVLELFLLILWVFLKRV